MAEGLRARFATETTPMDDLEPITPDEALRLYLEQRRTEVTASTIRSHRSRLGHFLDWCEQEGIENLNTLSGRDLHEFRLWRRHLNDGIAPVTEKTQMDTVRVFIRFVETIDGVRAGLSEKVQSPDIDAEQNTREVMLHPDQAEEVLDYLAKYEYASRPHVVLALMWNSMMRRGAVRALDVRDYHAADQSLDLHHRPETGTPLKNKKDGERMVALSARVCNLLDDWLETQRPAVEDEFGREPLVATAQGRIHANTINVYVYRWTRPCVTGAACPLDRDPEECEAMSGQTASKCPESVSSHAVRRGSITHHLESDVPTEVVSDRANVGPAVLDQHYDERSERQKMEQRRKYLRNL